MPLWGPILPALTERFKVVIFDNRGLGESGPIEDGWEATMPNIADDAAALMDALEIERAHVLGWSLGSAASQELAINHPEKVGSLTLYSTWGRVDGFMRSIVTAMRCAWAYGTAEERITGTALCFSPEALESPDFEVMFEQFAAGFPSTDEQVAAMIAQLDADAAHDTIDRLGQIDCPTLVLAGEQDVFTAARLGKEVADAIPGARYELFSGPGSAHGTHLERTEEWLGFVLDHLGNNPLSAPVATEAS